MLTQVAQSVLGGEPGLARAALRDVGLVRLSLHPWLAPGCGLALAALGGLLLLRRLPVGHAHAAGAHSHASWLKRLGLVDGSANCDGKGTSQSGVMERRLRTLAGTMLTLVGALLAAVPLWRAGLRAAESGSALRHLSLGSLQQGRLGPALFVAGLGLVLGVRHSTDADHVVAISTIVTRERSLRGAGLIGALWGLGHTVTIFLVGSLIILFGVAIPPRVGLSMEFSVALMLILLGVLNLSGVMQKIVARLSPSEAVPAELTLQKRRRGGPARYGAYQCLRPLIVGLVHGLAGSAAIALLVLSTIHNPFWAVMYLLIFGFGTMLGMMCMTAAMSLPMVYAGDRLPQVSRYLGVASGVVSVCFGSFLVYQLGYLGGLFTSHPHWTPQ